MSEQEFVQASQALLIETETGSVHRISCPDRSYSRLVAGDESGALRRDGEPLELIAVSKVQIGRPMAMILAPLSEDAVWTERVTSRVVRVVIDDPTRRLAE